MIRCPIDLDLGSGRQSGYLEIPYSYNLGGWAKLMVPIAIFRNGPGPVVLAMGANHGDEYPGPIALSRLWRELSPEQISGTLILLPWLNPPAAHAATRLSPLDGKNFNRCFPGNPHGSPSEMLAHFLSTELFPRASHVIDLHTGGRSLDFLPCAHMHDVPDPRQNREMRLAAEAFLTPDTFLYADVAGAGLLPSEAERQGKIVITTELGGSESVPAHIHRLCQRGLSNVLRHIGVLSGDPLPRTAPARWLAALDERDYLFAPESGIYENAVSLGEAVIAGQTLGWVHCPEVPDRAPAPVRALTPGVLIGCRAPSRLAQGDCVACVARELN
ncbi:MAG: succinylglutamate desuccinylase/aspartoacylase family protein [Acidobacteriota bacterium]